MCRCLFLEGKYAPIPGNLCSLETKKICKAASSDGHWTFSVFRCRNLRTVFWRNGGGKIVRDTYFDFFVFLFFGQLYRLESVPN